MAHCFQIHSNLKPVPPTPFPVVVTPCLQANEEAKALGVEAFSYGYVMIDKSKTEMAAVDLLVLSGDALGWLLCYFHMLQDWERFLTSADSGVVGREAQHAVMVALAHLAHCREESAFKAQVGRTAGGPKTRAESGRRSLQPCEQYVLYQPGCPLGSQLPHPPASLLFSVRHFPSATPACLTAVLSVPFPLCHTCTCSWSSSTPLTPPAPPCAAA